MNPLAVSFYALAELMVHLSKIHGSIEFDTIVLYNGDNNSRRRL